MNILAIDTSGHIASVAILSDGEILTEFTTNNKITHGENLAPLVDSAFKFTKLDYEDLDYIACSSGPGSFAGLRIGASFCKAVAHSLNIPIIPIPTLDVLAYNIFDCNSLIVPIIDAKRNQLYASIYQRENTDLKRISDYLLIEFHELENLIKKENKKAVFLGDGVKLHKDKILENHSIASLNNLSQRAGSLVSAAVNNLDEKVHYKDFAPFYIKLSQAEEDLNKKT